MEWISVDKRTPNDYELVLVYCNNGSKPGITVYRWNNECYKANQITYWMPLPKPPN
ncbi:MAG TPA: hypothetical protein DDW50_17990 [Firmicutes bacterium]|jgi:hypothetical protein|nr:hypothetical protein [Bacillota bacterium]